MIASFNNRNIKSVIASDARMDKKLELEVSIAAGNGAFKQGIMDWGELTAFTCPDCHGTLLKLKEGNSERFRCHTGHAFSVESLLSGINENVEDSMWNTIRALEESVMLFNHLEKHLAAEKSPLSALCSKKTREAERRARIIREIVCETAEKPAK